MPCVVFKTEKESFFKILCDGKKVCDRPPGKNCIKETIESLKVSDILEYAKLVIAESGSDDTSYLDFLKNEKAIEVHYPEKRLHFGQNFLRALRLVAEEKVDYVIFIEDDIIVDRKIHKYFDRLVTRCLERGLWTMNAAYHGKSSRKTCLHVLFSKCLKKRCMP